VVSLKFEKEIQRKKEKDCLWKEKQEEKRNNVRNQKVKY
jgi:hypothetical protein